MIPVLYIAFVVNIYKKMTGSGPAPGRLLRRGVRRSASSPPPTTFSDVVGIESSKGEVVELVDSLRNPGKYEAFGARAPKGVLLCGPPGTGKTLLAKAVAGSAGLPILTCSGSDFVEMFVGRGAARVRGVFDKASKLGRCIIFIDELDALGKARQGPGVSSFRGNDEQEQTLNQLLACMDGVSTGSGTIVLAATNRYEVLDEALVRPGRFDRIVKVELPNFEGRVSIFKLYSRKLRGFNDSFVDFSALGEMTKGCSGAEIESIVNEAAIRAVRRFENEKRTGGNFDGQPNRQMVTMDDFVDAASNFYATRKKGVVGGIMANMRRTRKT